MKNLDDIKDPSSKDFADWLKTLSKSEAVVSDPYSIDDRDAPLAPNFYRFCVDEKWLNTQPLPFPWQLEVGMRIYGDMCCFCSEQKWYKNGIPFDVDPLEIPERMRLRKNGVCPQCERSIIDGIKSGREHDVQNYIGVVGQRSGKCLVADTLVPTKRGLQYIKNVEVGDEVLVNGAFHAVTETHKNGKKKVGVLTTSKGYTIEGTPEHKVYTPNGWKALNETDTVILFAESNRIWTKEQTEEYARNSSSYNYDLSFVANAEVSIAAQIMRFYVVEEHVGDCRLILDVKNAIFFQQALLSFGIFCERQGDYKIIIEHPWAVKYVETIGVQEEIVKNYILQSQKVKSALLNHDQCVHLAEALARLDVNTMMVHPELKHKMQIVYSACLHNNLSHSQCHDAVEILYHLPIEPILKAQTIKTFKMAADNLCYWDTVKKFKMTQRTKVYDITVPSISSFVANGIYTHNSTGIGFPILYLVHRLLKLKNPSEFYGIKAGTVLDVHFIAIDYTGAKKNMFNPMMENYNSSPWFETYNQILDHAAKRRGEDELYKIKDTFISYRNAGLYVGPKSPSTRALRGSTRIAYVVDELGHFSENKELVNISGIEIWNALRNSLQTIRMETKRLRREGIVYIPPALALAISSPRDVADPIMVLRNQYAKDNDSYTVLRPTWEANPKFTYADLASEIKDPISLARDFGCKPPFSEAAFIADPEYLFNAIDENYSASTHQETIFINKSNTDSAIRVTTVKLKFRSYDDTVPKIFAFDAGRELNAFGGCVGYLNQDGKFVVDTLIEVRPRSNSHVSFSEVYRNVFQPLIEKLNVVALASDRWQNYKLIDDAQDDYRGIVILSHQLNYDDFLQFRDNLINGQIILPRPEISNNDIIDVDRTEEEYFDDKPVAQFIRQSLRVVDEPGKTVSKPSIGNDDVFRAVVVAESAIRSHEVSRVIRQGSIKRKSAGAIGVVATGSYYRNIVKPLGVGVRDGMVMPKIEESIPLDPVFKNVRTKDGARKIRQRVKPKVKYK